MANALDVASYIVHKQGSMPAMKLHKLVYYSQAWSLVWDDKPLFKNRIEAWANGPVVSALYQAHRGKFRVHSSDINGHRSKLSATEKHTVDAVLSHYGRKSSQWLSDLTHREPPWKDARGDLSPSERGRVEITHAAMAEYYGSL